MAVDPGMEAELCKVRRCGIIPGHDLLQAARIVIEIERQMPCEMRKFALQLFISLAVKFNQTTVRNRIPEDINISHKRKDGTTRKPLSTKAKGVALP